MDKTNTMKTAKIKSTGSQVFNVPNTKEGREFIKMISKYLNKTQLTSIKSRGRGNRGRTSQEKRCYKSDLPVHMAEWFAIYLKNKNFNHHTNFVNGLIAEKVALEKRVREMNEKTLRREQEVIILCSKCSEEKRKQAVETCKSCEFRKQMGLPNLIKLTGSSERVKTIAMENESLLDENESLRKKNEGSENVIKILREENDKLRERYNKNGELILALNTIKKFFTESN